MTDWPSVGVVIPTHDRPQQMRAALRSVLTQFYPGELEVIVVFDRAKPAPGLEEELNGGSGEASKRPVRVVRNERTPGLAGARNTGITALETDLVAFLDDDDEWLPGKLTAQVAALGTEAELCTTAIEVDYRGRRNARLAQRSTVRHVDLLRSRMMMLHSSTFLFRRSALLGGLGLVAEDAPGSQNEDWDMLLRASRRRPIAHVDVPYALVNWAGSHFETRWDTKISSLRWILDRHPEIHGSPEGAARVYGQIACWHAAIGDRKEALRWALRATKANPGEPRAAVAAAAAAGIVGVPAVMAALHRRGRGI
ncbi:glycosyltransferase family 2 protein [Glycomyces terrestris]|uniref:Glycosyltransferase family 2 protein n=1 Tax=Glycomyces terrestris TaxID=2493553 RepID=A0A426V088_9ACTN|nr:glycosyltransferase family 2 protein [Glycomyces terrestris]RRS00274.1 glycosyltransferase family 2 protein [Glycomyces terrestris]